MSDPVQPWPTLPLGTLANEMCLGKMLDKQKNRGTLQPYLRNVNVRWFSFDLNDLKEMRFQEGEGTRYGLQRGDLVICEGGEPGRAAVWKGQTECARIQKALHRVRFHADEYDPSFAMYYLYFGTITSRFASHYTGSTIKHLTGASLSQIPFPIPSLNEQGRIVAKIEELFSDLDAGVAALERARANLKRYRAAVLKAAVEGKLTEQWRAEHPATEPASKLLERILAGRRKKWEADQLAKFAAAGKMPPTDWREKYVEPAGPDTPQLPTLPDGWWWVTVDQMLREPTCNGISVKGSDAPPGVPALRLSAMSPSGFDYQDRRYIPIDAVEAAALAVHEGDFFVSRGNGSLHLLGRGTLAQAPEEQIVFPDTMIRLRFIKVGVLAKLFSTLWASRVIRKQIEKKARTTAGIFKISQRDVEAFCLPLPPLAEQEQILTEVERLLSVVAATEGQIEADIRGAARLRQSILKQAFEGKLVAQDPADEPAAKLLERIAAQRRAAASLASDAGAGHNTRRKRKAGAKPDAPEGQT